MSSNATGNFSKSITPGQPAQHPNIRLRKTVQQDLELFFNFQLDEKARFMAAFTPKDSISQQAYLDKYIPFLNDSTKNLQTILLADSVVGSISKFEIEQQAEITYWISRNYWGQRIATEALRQFLLLEKMRPIYGRTAFDNTGSQQVLLQNGFIKTGEDRGFAGARNKEIDEFIYKLS
ncbi:Protein N-acetyltransferase, RimJ/RimL family [Arachidicoccus rhizosphaerae]|uniref:Protein N-acetyltransferase, RimJ/RimL family n=1 Tax=Arachidicoccus rhizosphaerae TaxID=551991 RepID=A0A1H4B4K3_9BACT|nr:GNAT family N-acetyltransferase [Arachidicoccus rhizosphaerae]SEA43090.1 Protein N-acetyltransferase, RimJ/RimL family [Arachidicoccus rhizosphaerae]